MAPAVTPATVPEGSGIRASLSGASFHDSWEAPMPAQMTALEFYLFLVTRTPAWIDFLMAVRNKSVRLVGLKDLGALGGFDPKRPAASYAVGDRVGIFSLLALSDDEVILGDNDRHLGVKVSLCRVQGSNGPRAVVTTVVHVHNTLGRLYMLVVVPFHKRIVPAMLARANA